MQHLYLALALLVAGCSSVPSTAPPISVGGEIRQPETGTGVTAQPGWHGDRFAVATANPLASEAGVTMLKAGGSAIDAAIAAQMVLTLVEPQSSGIGGGAFLLHYDGRETVAFDGRETAPAAASETLFLKPDGKAMTFHEAIVGGRAVGVPGVVRMLEAAHAEFGARHTGDDLVLHDVGCVGVGLAQLGIAVLDRPHFLTGLRVQRDQRGVGLLQQDLAVAETQTTVDRIAATGC